ncbi:MAG: hypothetical protein CVU72_00045 [Deltaproteobacteria bacterium HGW-Deltaproteobacteria-7]|jgi:hypothetical protein|nr:MAG: hypothetical protein CVU72_00045 [Deltaproteobacteria bacterium HGW-Deltaproteobacteria-7]PKN20773.1 MAG: hypothetical protein CVU71_03055 [Deltaproteobacteria bacterium HGW-Deltaproteobacteria-6]
MAVLPVNSNTPITINKTAETARNNHPLPNLVPGETLTVSVIEKQSANQYLMAMKDGGPIVAKSDISLNVGEKLQVKVQSVQPQIILNVIDTQKQSTDAKVNERLLQWHVNPDSLIMLLNKVDEFSANLKSVNLSQVMSPPKIDALMKLFNNIIFSSQTKINPLFVKDFISQFGLFLENDLSRIASLSSKDGKTPILVENLKASLLNLSAALTETLKDITKLDTQIAAKLMNLSSFTSEALKTIEARQAVNVVFQQNESGLYLQIPVAAGETLRQADIFITPDDKHAAGAKKYSACNVVIFLNLDYLGEININASVREGRIRCLIKCESEEVKLLLAASADQLKKALGDIGYGIDQIDCLKASELKLRKTEFIEQQLLGSLDLVNHFA